MMKLILSQIILSYGYKMDWSEVYSPIDLIDKYPCSPTVRETVRDNRKAVQAIINGKDDRLLVIVGPCSIHNIDEALEYARRLKEIADRHRDHLVILMRVYLEKPRTSVGWKGLLHDPDLDGSCNLNRGLEVSRELLIKINELGLGCATEMLDILTPSYLGDLISWCCIGARTSESQPHRQMASGLEMPVGFKNGTTGSFKIAIDAMIACRHSHSYLGVNPHGQVSVVKTAGNPDGHIVLRGGWDGPTIRPNYYMEDVQRVVQLLQYAGLDGKEVVVIDCSHGNSMKKYQNQSAVAHYLAENIGRGNTNVVGVMLESNINEGSQDFKVAVGAKNQLKPGVSVTDACINLQTTDEVLEELAIAVKNRRLLV